MKSPILPAALLACVLAVPALAQEAADNTAAAATDDGALEVGATYVAETHGDWEIRCLVAPEGQPEPCQLYQLLYDTAENAVAEFNLVDIPDEGTMVAGATIVTPLDTLLSPNMRMRVDDGPERAYPFRFCQPIGCFVQIGLTADDVQAFRAGGEATISIVPLPAPDQVVNITVSLIGFTAGFEALAALSPAQ